MIDKADFLSYDWSNNGTPMHASETGQTWRAEGDPARQTVPLREQRDRRSAETSEPPESETPTMRPPENNEERLMAFLGTFTPEHLRAENERLADLKDRLRAEARTFAETMPSVAAVIEKILEEEVEPLLAATQWKRGIDKHFGDFPKKMPGTPRIPSEALEGLEPDVTEYGNPPAALPPEEKPTVAPPRRGKRPAA